MGQLYCTGPALFYVGIPVSWTDTLQQIQQTTTRPGVPEPIASSLNPRAIAFTNATGRGVLDVQQLIPVVLIEQLNTVYVPLFLGTAETPPSIEILARWDEVETDAGGTEQASERLTDGEEALIQAVFTRFNEAVYQALAARSQTNALAGRAPGWSQVGRAIALERLTLPLWVTFPYAQKDVYALAGMPAGYRFYDAFLESPDRLENLGTVARSTGLQFRAQRLLQLVESVNDLAQPFDNYRDIPLPSPVLLPVERRQLAIVDNSLGGLYDGDTSGLPAPD